MPRTCFKARLTGGHYRTLELVQAGPQTKHLCMITRTVYTSYLRIPTMSCSKLAWSVWGAETVPVCDTVRRRVLVAIQYVTPLCWRQGTARFWFKNWRKLVCAIPGVGQNLSAKTPSLLPAEIVTLFFRSKVVLISSTLSTEKVPTVPTVIVQHWRRLTMIWYVWDCMAVTAVLRPSKTSCGFTWEDLHWPWLEGCK